MDALEHLFEEPEPPSKPGLFTRVRCDLFDVVDRQIAAFRGGLAEIAGGAGADLSGFWTHLEKCLAALVQELSFRFIFVFGVRSTNGEQFRPLSVVACAGDIPETLKRDLSLLACVAPTSAATTEVSSQDDEAAFGYIQGFDEHFDRSKSLVISFPVPLVPQASFVVLVGYKEDCLPTPKENKRDSDLNRALRLFCETVASALSSVAAFLGQANEREMLRMFPHELSQVCAGLDALRFLYFHVKRGRRTLTDNDFDDLDVDIQSCTGQLRLALLNMEQSMGGIRIPQRQPFWLFGDVIVKWVNTYRVRAEMYSMSIIHPDICREDPLRPMVWADPILIEQVVYNLLSNAFKYSYSGTNVYIDCRLEDPLDPGSPHLLTATNFGLWLNSSVDIFSRFGRGRNATGVEGMGLGLYIVKQIAEAHGGAVSVEIESISQYNVPLIEHYICRTFAGKQEGRVKDLREEQARLKRAGHLDRIVASSAKTRAPFVPCDDELLRDIKKPTCLIRMEVTIPRCIDIGFRETSRPSTGNARRRSCPRADSKRWAGIAVKLCYV